MNEQEMYPVCTILYKTDSSDGWHYAIMSGDEEVCKLECEKLKQENNWLDYKCYVSVRYVDKQDIPFRNHSPVAEYLHRCTSLIYNPFDKKYYYTEEQMPYPNEQGIHTQNFEIIVKGEGEDDENIWEPTDEDDFESGADITISFGNNQHKIITIADDIEKDIPNFIQRLKNTKYANLVIEEYTYTKFLAWEFDNTVRFIVQDYSGDDVISIWDNILDKDLFYSEFENFYSKIKEYLRKHLQLYEKFKLQQCFINSLKWVYDRTNMEMPQEYTCFDWDKSKLKDLENFANEIAEKSDNHVLDWTKSKIRFNCLDLNDYYYWVLENKIVRTMSYPHQRGDIKRFLTSDDFIFIKDMSLSDIYNQLLDKGYNCVIDCKYIGKNIKIYANGQVESKEASKEQIKDAEQIIQSIAGKFEDRNNIMVSDIVDLIRDYNMDSISYRDGKMKF